MDIISNVNAVNTLNPNQSEVFLKPRKIINEVESEKKTFAEFVTDAVNSVDQAHKTAEQKTEDFIMGKAENVHDVMIAMERAKVSFDMMVQIRNRVVETYQEISRMPI